MVVVEQRLSALVGALGEEKTKAWEEKMAWHGLDLQMVSYFG